MNSYDIKRLALILAVQAEIEAMKANNQAYPENMGYGENEFWNRAEELRILATKHDEQL